MPRCNGSRTRSQTSDASQRVTTGMSVARNRVSVVTDSPQITDTAQPAEPGAEARQRHAELTERVAWTVFGAAAFGFGRLAAGSLDIAVCSGAIGAYDVCALVPIVEGAGGRITDDEDQPLTIRTPHACIAAATPQLHAETLRVLNGE